MAEEDVDKRILSRWNTWLSVWLCFSPNNDSNSTEKVLSKNWYITIHSSPLRYIQKAESSSFPHVPKLRRKFQWNIFFASTTTLWNKLPCECFPKHCDHNLFNAKVNHYLFTLSEYSSIPYTSSFFHINTPFTIAIFTINLYVESFVFDEFKYFKKKSRRTYFCI